MNAKFYPQVLTGTTEAQAYKPLAMRYFALAGVAEGQTKIYLKTETEDILALKDALGDIGVSVSRSASFYTVTPPEQGAIYCLRLDVKNSLASFRFLLPLLSAKNNQVEYVGGSRLARKDFTAGTAILKGITLLGKSFPLEAVGRLSAGEFILEPEINSQLACALIMALPLVNGDSVVRFSEKPKRGLNAMIELTLGAMREFGVSVDKRENEITIQGNQKYIAPKKELTVYGDYATAGYFLGANLIGSAIKVDNLNESSLQPEKDIVGYLSALERGGEIRLKGKTDFIFLLTALACVMPNKTKFTGVKLKQKDERKFSEYILALTRLGGDIIFDGDCLTVVGGKLKGDIMLDTLNDARVAMSLIILSTAVQTPVTLLSAEMGMQEQASFINEFIRLGGKCQVI